MIDQEPEPQYEWVSSNPSDFDMKVEGGERFYRRPQGPSWYGWMELTDQIIERLGFTRVETSASRIARLEWRVRQLELELERRQDWEREMQEGY